MRQYTHIAPTTKASNQSNQKSLKEMQIKLDRLAINSIGSEPVAETPKCTQCDNSTTIKDTEQSREVEKLTASEQKADAG